MASAKKTNKKPGGRKSSSARRTSPRKAMRDMPRWKHILIAVAISAGALFISYHLFLKQMIFRFEECNGTKAYGVCFPKGYLVFGIDISHHQGSINWEKVISSNSKDVPISFVYMKATEGGNHKDKRFKKNWDAASEHGFMRGAYHYFTETSSGDAQAANFINNVKLETGDLPPVVDIEEEPKDATAFSTELKKLILRLEDHYGVKPIIYSYSKYIGRYLQDSFFDDYKLWIAHYEVEEPKVSRGWTIWQYTDKGDIPGINEDVDINIFNGSMPQLKELLIK